jgi:co-chaperonin GroES (HSP10)
MMKLLIGMLLLIALATSGNAQTKQDSAAVTKELTRTAQELFDAVAVGNKAVWEKYVADDVIYTDENWKILTKKDLVDSLAPLPKGYSGSITMANIQSRVNGDAAVLSYRALEEETVLGQKLTPTYLVTDTYFRRNGRWQLVASHVVVMPSERKPVEADPKDYEALVGDYELSAGTVYTVSIDGSKLMGQRTGRSTEELLPADKNTFFPKGTIRGEKVFVRDGSGRAVKFLDRRENNDLVWTRVR